MFISLCIIFLNLVSNNAICFEENSTILYVGGKNTGNFSSIQDAIDNSNTNDTIYIFDGTYNESIVIDKSINLIGFDKNTTIILGNKDLYTIYIKSTGVKIEGFTIQNGEIGVYVSGSEYSSINITGNIISNNQDGIRLYNSSNNIITDNFVENNSDYGIVLYESKDNLISENSLFNNREALIIGRWSNNNVIYNNNITMHDFGIKIDFSFNNKVYKNLITNGMNGIFLNYAKNNNVTNNTIMYHDKAGIFLSYSEDNIISPNIFLDNYQDVKEKSSPPKIKAPGFEILMVIFAILLFTVLKKKSLKF